MGQQQLLLIILGVIIVGIAIAVGLSLFTSQSIQSNKDGMINDINNIAANAYQYYIRPLSMGGGAGAYTNYKIPVQMSSNENGTYSASGNQITGTSANGTVVGVVATDGRVQMSFTGNFAQ